LDEEALHEDYRPYLEQYKWLLSTGSVEIDTRFCEFKVYSESLDVSGTLDRIWWINGERGLLDIKTGVSDPAHEIQTALYQICFEEMFPKMKINKRHSLYLNGGAPDKYKLKPHESPHDKAYATGAVLAARWRVQNKRV
jgi:hypothetical protein